MDVKITVGLKKEPKIRAGVPALTYHGGPLLANVEVTTIYWGSAWASDPLRTQLDEFFDFVVTSSLIDQLVEYNQQGYTVGHGKHVQSVLLTDDPATPLDDSAIQSRLDSLIAAGTVGQPNANSVYFLFLPSGVTVTIDGSSSCAQFCGYHNLSNSGVVYAVDTYDDCAGCQFVSGDTLASSTVVASHELCEAITDPQLDGWYDDATGEEIGDICEGSSKQIGGGAAAEALSPFEQAGAIYTLSGTGTADPAGNISGTFTLTTAAAPPPPPPPSPGQVWTVQKEWSNAQGSCI